MTFKEECVFIILFISVIAFTSWLIDRNIKSTKECEDKGGVEVHSLCLKVEVLR